MQTFITKTVAERIAKTTYGDDYLDKGELKQNDNEEWFYLPNQGVEPLPPPPPKPSTKPFIPVSKCAKPVSVLRELCESMKGAKRIDVIRAAVAKGVTFHTARTQYQKWFKKQKQLKHKP